MACCTTIPPLNNKRKSGGLFDLPRSTKHRRPLSSSNLSTTSPFVTSSNSPSKSTMFTTAASASNKQLFIETDINNKASVFQSKSSYSPLGSLWNSTEQEVEQKNDEGQFKNDLMERIRHEAKRLIKRKQLTTVTANSSDKPETTTPDAISPKKLIDNSQNYNDLPIFSMSQVNMICDRMLKERESALREQYDKILTQKLSEQYDAFVKFTHEQIQRKFATSQCSYVS